MCCQIRFQSEEFQPSASFSLQPYPPRNGMTMVRFGNIAFLFLALCLFLPSSLFAQQAGAINGQVTDQNGAAIPGAQVTLTLTGQGTIFKAITNSAGEYSVPALDAGTYNLQVTAPGLQSSRRRASCCASRAPKEWMPSWPSAR